MRVAIVVVLVGCTSSPGSMTKEQLGKLAFEDPGLSTPAGQACADCHAAKAAFRDPESDFSTSRGVIPTRFGSRNAPTALYARYIPPRTSDAAGSHGGLFWDGRANSLEEQALGPLLNPLEMNNPDRAAILANLRAASYAPAFRAVFGGAALDDPDTAVAHLTEAIAAYERSDELAPFTSKYDAYMAGTEALTDSEQRGLGLFEAHCASCHPPPLFTDFSYANLGIPKYANNRFLQQPPDLNPAGTAFVDHGLADGKFRTPTLRNVVRTGPFGHNGYFENVPYMLEFLNTRDVGTWAPPEVATGIDRSVGNLGLTSADVDDLYAFLTTLSDR
jgi:cytochrome c peroxidase